MKTYDVIVKREREGKAYWDRVGRFIIKDNGKMAIKFDAIPIGWDGWAQISEEFKGSQPAQTDETIIREPF